MYTIYFERIYRNVDTVLQLYTGIALGVVVSLVMFTILYHIMSTFGDDITDIWIMRFFNVRNEYFGNASNNGGCSKAHPGLQVRRTTRDNPLFVSLATLKAQSPLRLLVELPASHQHAVGQPAERV